LTQFKIPIIEYKSAKPGKAIKPAHKSFVMNDRQLIVSMARATLTVNSGKLSRKYMAAIVKPTLMFLLDWKRAPNLCVSNDFRRALRDFSITMRIGELAQGVSYAFWKWERGYSWISDFGPWAAGLVPPYAEKKSPDFVMLNLITNEIVIMESKGTGNACHKGSMRRALFQCEFALHLNTVSRCFGSILTLDSKNPMGIGTLHIRDPEDSAMLTDELKHYIFRHSYASWFDLTGDEKRSTECRKPLATKNDVLEISDVADQEKETSITALRDITAAIGFDPEYTEYRIDTEIKKALDDFDFFKQIEWDKFSERMKAQSSSQEKQVHFPDGTSIVEQLP